MNEKLSEIKSDLVESKAKLEKVSADVTRLHAKIDSIGEMPTTEEWAEVKTLSEELKAGLTSVDEQTPEETTP